MEIHCAMQLLNILPPDSDSEYYQAKAAHQKWKKSKREMRDRQEKVWLRKMHEKMEARCNLLPRGTSPHSNPLSMPLMMRMVPLAGPSTFHDEVSLEPTPESVTSPASSSLSYAPPKKSPRSSVDFHSIDSWL